MAFTTTELLSSVKLKAFAPSRQTTITDANILTMATEEMLGYIVPNILAVNSGYFQRNEDFTVSGATEYRIPYRAIGGRVSSVFLVNSAGDEIPLPIVDYTEEAAREPNSESYYGSVAYIRNAKLYLVPTPNTATTLRMTYYIRPGDLVATSSALTVSSFNSTTITLSANGSTIGLTTGVSFDIIYQNPIYDHVAIDQSGSVSSAVVTLTTPSGVAAGNYVALAGQSPVPQIPAELHPVLIQRTAARVLEILGDRQGMEAAYATAQMWEAKALHLLTPRVEQTPPKLVNNQWGVTGRFRNLLFP